MAPGASATPLQTPQQMRRENAVTRLCAWICEPTVYRLDWARQLGTPSSVASVQQRPATPNTDVSPVIFSNNRYDFVAFSPQPLNGFRDRRSAGDH